jgi:hypothetical protein
MGGGFHNCRHRHGVTVSDFWSIVIGNAILAAAYGLFWSGARNFEGKRFSIVLTLAGGAGLARCVLHRPDPRAAGSSRHRMAAIAIAYALLTVIELWRGRGDGTRRWPIMLLLLGLQRSAEADCRG